VVCFVEKIVMAGTCVTCWARRLCCRV